MVAGAAFDLWATIKIQSEMATVAMPRATSRCTPRWQSVARLSVTEIAVAQRKDVTVNCITAKSADLAVTFRDGQPSIGQAFST